MAVERHEVQLVANITDFKNKMKEAQNTANSMGKKLQNSLNLGKGLFDDTELTKRMIQADNNVSKLSVNFGKLSQNMALTKSNVYEVSSGLENISQDAQKVQVNVMGAGNSIGKAFDKGLKSVKRLTIGFLGARTAFGLFRKYMSEYSSQNEDFANKMQLTTNVITNALAPAFEFFGNVVQYAVIGLARIIELLTGVNILGKTVDNSFKGASKSAKELNDNLSGLDEISNIQEDSGGLSTGIGSQLNALNEFQKKIAEVDAWLEKSGIKKFFTNLRKIIGNLWEGFKSQPSWLKWLEVGIGTAGLLLLKLGGSTGLYGLLIVIGAITFTALISQFNKLKKTVEDTKESAEDITKQSKNVGDKVEETTEKITKNIREGTYSAEELNKSFYNASGSIMDSIDSFITGSKKLKEESFGLKGWINDIFDTGVIEAHEQSVETEMKTIEMYISIMKELDDQNKLNTKQQIEYSDTLTEVKNKLEEAGLEGKEYENILSKVDDELNKLKDKNITSTFTVKGKAETKQMETDFSNSFSRIMAGISNAITWLPNKLFGGKANGGIFAGHWQPITAYAGGGLPDAGQMFVARENGPEMVGTIGGHTAVINNDQIVASVSAGVYEAVMSAMSNQDNKAIVLNVNGKELAKATYSDYQEESSRRGANTSIRRV